MNRRQFLTLAGSLPVTLAAFPGAVLAAPNWNRVLVLVELQGGNDGLNTVIPYGDPAYARLRPKLAVARDKVLQLDERLGFHPALSPLMPIWDEGKLGVALGVGYDDPNLSHFRSIEIWETASGSEDYLDQGWIARAFSSSPPPRRLAADGIVMAGGPGPLAGEGLRMINMDDPEKFVKRANRMAAPGPSAANPALAHILKVQGRLRHAARVIMEKDLQNVDPGASFPKTPFARQMEQTARLLAAGIAPPVIKTAIGSFDTHSNQAGVHARLLGQLAGGLLAFTQALKANGLWGRVLIMTYSEFGRRAGENGSKGTDHGTAAPHFLLGGRLKGGMYGEQPALDQLVNGNLVSRLHFRRLYATAAREWWGLKGAGLKEKPLGCIA